MSLAKRLKNSQAIEGVSINCGTAKVLQETLWGEPEPVEMLGLVTEQEPEEKPVADPRPDLAADSRLWTRFLELATEKDRHLAGTLHGFRCQGTRLRRGKNGYVLRPEVGPQAWSSRQEYERERDRWLKPYLPEIKELLKSLLKRL